MTKNTHSLVHHWQPYEKEMRITNNIRFFQLDHSHKKQHSLETSARLLFMLLQDFFASARLQSAQNLFLPKSAVHYLCYLKSSKTIGQRKTTNTEKYFHP